MTMTIDIPFIDAAMPDNADRRQGERRQESCKLESCEHITGVQAQVEALKLQLEATTEKIHCIETKLDANTQATEENNKASAQILEIVEMGEGFFKGVKATGKWARKIVMWFAPPITAAIGMWYAITNRPQ